MINTQCVCCGRFFSYSALGVLFCYLFIFFTMKNVISQPLEKKVVSLTPLYLDLKTDILLFTVGYHASQSKTIWVSERDH